MLGGMLAGHDESGGEMVERDGRKFKVFYGMSSSTAMTKYKGGVAEYRSSEGKTVEVPYRGAVQDTINDLLGGIRSTCTYVGAGTHTALSRYARGVSTDALACSSPQGTFQAHHFHPRHAAAQHRLWQPVSICAL